MRVIAFTKVFIFLWIVLGVSISSAYRKTQPAHESLPCKECHILQAGQVQEELVTGTRTMALCLRCHPESNLHPTGIPLPREMRGTVVVILPFGKGEEEGQIICLTCHYLHPPKDSARRPFLLRGGGEGDPLTNLCLFCHLYGLDTQNPHVEKKRCVYCHMAPTEKAKESYEIRLFLARHTCEVCHGSFATHPAPEKRCQEKFNPFKDPEVAKQRKVFGVLRARLLCSDCHDVHGVWEANSKDPRRRFLLKEKYLQAAALSRSIDPHWTGVFCQACHAGQPEKGRPRLKFRDINAVCQRCHDNRFAKADIHPVGVKPSRYVHIPEDFPLKDGRLTCETCHVASLQICYPKDKRAPRNPKFLRRPEVPRDDYCLICHGLDYYRRLDPHKQQIVKGKINKKTCLFCHSSLPNLEEMGTKHVKFVVDNPNKPCLICHPGMNMGHPAGVNHLRRPSGKILRAIQTSVDRIGVEFPLYKGRIICATCHNPHQPGVLKIKAAAKGAGKPQRLRYRTEKSICIGCHVDK